MQLRAATSQQVVRSAPDHGVAGPFSVHANQVSLLSSLVEALVESVVPGALVSLSAERNQPGLRGSDVLLANSANGRSLVVFGAAPDAAAVATHFAAGVHSMISVEASREDLIAAVKSLLDGPAFVSSGVVLALARPPRSAEEASLSAREREIVRLVLEGMSNQDMATLLCLSPNTVRTHLQSASSKLGVRGRTRLAARARALGLA